MSRGGGLEGYNKFSALIICILDGDGGISKLRSPGRKKKNQKKILPNHNKMKIIRHSLSEGYLKLLTAAFTVLVFSCQH